jgi:tRNA-modifying protein YgfZ
MIVPENAFALPQFSVLLVSGTDARTYLQGQLSCDLDALTRETRMLGSLNSPQGRVQAVLWIVERTEGIALVVGASIADETMARLKKYILRAKVQITASPLKCFGVYASSATGHSEHEGVSRIQWTDKPARTLLLAAGHDVGHRDAERWHLDDVRAGLPQIYPITRESFVAQMLNLEDLGGISFEKGCYTGQEIIARAHFRGAVKRRMYRYRSSATHVAPGTRVLSEGGHVGEIVDAANESEGSEVLAVVSIDQHDAPLTLDGAGAALTLSLRLEA